MRMLSKTAERTAPHSRVPDATHPAVSVLLVTDQFLPVVGGTEVSTLRQATALQGHGYAVRVLTLRHNPRWPRTEMMKGVPIRRTGGFFLRGRLRLRFGATWLAEARVWYELVRTRRTYDVVQVRQLGRLARPAMLASFVTRKPLVVRVACASVSGSQAASQGTVAPEGMSTFPVRLSPRRRDMSPDMGDVATLRRVQLLAPVTLRLLRARQVTLLALSTRLRAHLVETGFRPERIVLLPNGIDVDDYAEAARNRAIRSPAAMSESKIIVCAARLSYQKGQDVLLHAWRVVREHVPTARLILAGDGAERQPLEQLASCLGILDSVEFAGLIADLPALLAEASGFVLPSRFEGMPNALLEAMAAGLPCIATRVSGTEDVIVNGQSGLLVAPEDPDALASGLLAILTDQNRACELGQQARARVVSTFDQKHHVDQLVCLYTKLATAGGTSHLQSSFSRSGKRHVLAAGAAGSQRHAQDDQDLHRTGDAADSDSGSALNTSPKEALTCAE